MMAISAGEFDGLTLEHVVAGRQFTEGPVWVKPNRLIFSDIPANKLFALVGDQLSAYRDPSENANGNTLDGQGRLISCLHGARKVVRQEPDGRLTTLAERYQGKRLNSPNDAVVDAKGRIFFTDPPYGINPNDSELKFNGVFRIDPTGTLTLLDDTLKRPNGIGISPDGKTLYVSDTEGPTIVAWDLDADGNVKNRRVFATLSGVSPVYPDGLRVDQHGRVLCTGGKAVHVYAPDGRRLALIPVPESATNVAFGGPDGRTLFITAGTSVYRTRTQTPGFRPEGGRW